VRFVPKSDPSKVLIGEPVDAELDVGLALYKGQEVSVRPFTGASVLAPGAATNGTEVIERLLSPLAEQEVGSIRCVGLNVSVSLIVNIANCILIQPIVHFAR